MSIKEQKENKGPLTKEEELVNSVMSWLEDSSEESEEWLNRQDKWYRLRYRVKKAKTKPFVGCSNIRLPTLDTKIKKLKAELMQSVFGVRPIVQVVPTPGGNPQVAEKIEKFLDHLVMDVINIKKKATIAIDQELQKGFYLLKPFWNIDVSSRTIEFDTETLGQEEKIIIFDPVTPREQIIEFFAAKFELDMGQLVLEDNAIAIQAFVDKVLSGEQKVKIVLKDVIKNCPDVALVDPEKLVVNADAGFDPQSTAYMIHEAYLSYNEVVSCIEHKGWKKDILDKIDFYKDADLSGSDIVKSIREGISYLKETNKIKVAECYCYWDINNDGKDEKCIITVSPDFRVLLRAIEVPYPSYRFPFVKLFYELTDDRWFSHRGLPELLEDLVKEIDIQHMQRIDSQTLRNTPMFLYRAGQISERTKSFGFAHGIAVSGMQQLKDVIAPFTATNTNAEYSYKDEQQVLELKIGELIGQVDFGLQSQINRREPRTAQEVQMQVTSQALNFSLDADMHRQQFEELFNWIWELWCMYGDDQYEFNYFGEGKYEPIKLSREELQGKYTIKVKANDNNFNPQVRQEKATLVLQDTYNALQMGLVDPQAAILARLNALKEIGIENAEQFVTPPQPKQPGPQSQPIIINFADLSNAEKAQVLAAQGIQIDLPGRAIERTKQEEQDKYKVLLETAKIAGK